MSYYKEHKEAASLSMKKYQSSDKGRIVSKKATDKFRKTKRGVLCNIYNGQKERRPVLYYLEDLISKFIDDKKFNRLFNEWVKSGYVKNRKPSIDRINFKKDYTIDNIEVKTWEDNRYKQRMEIKLINGKRVGAFKDSVLIKEFINQRIAADWAGCFQASISSACRKNKIINGYEWKFL